MTKRSVPKAKLLEKLEGFTRTSGDSLWIGIPYAATARESVRNLLSDVVGSSEKLLFTAEDIVALSKAVDSQELHPYGHEDGKPKLREQAKLVLVYVRGEIFGPDIDGAVSKAFPKGTADETRLATALLRAINEVHPEATPGEMATLADKAAALLYNLAKTLMVHHATGIDRTSGSKRER